MFWERLKNITFAENKGLGIRVGEARETQYLAKNPCTSLYISTADL